MAFQSDCEILMKFGSVAWLVGWLIQLLMWRQMSMDWMKISNSIFSHKMVEAYTSFMYSKMHMAALHWFGLVWFVSFVYNEQSYANTIYGLCPMYTICTERITQRSVLISGYVALSCCAYEVFKHHLQPEIRY